MARGQLRIYVGAVTGVATTEAVLAEGVRRRADGVRVAIGCADLRECGKTEALSHELAANAPAALDVAAVVASRPDVVLVAELGISDGPGPPARVRWEGAAAVLDAGIDVVASVSIEHVESLAGTVTAITGRPPTGCVPDDFLRRAGDVQLVDMTPDQMRRRVVDGAVVASGGDAVHGALLSGSAFAALRALTVSWLADQLRDVDGDDPGERVVVAVTDGAGSDAVIRAAARLAQRSRSRLVGVRVRRPGTGEVGTVLGERRRLVRDLGGDYQEVESQDVAGALVTFARDEGATQLMLGASRRTLLQRVRGGSIVNDVLRRAGDLDVHVVAHPTASGGTVGWRWSRDSPISRPRRITGFLGGAVLLLALTLALVAIREHVSVSTAISLHLLAVVAIAAVGGLGPGLAAGLAAPLLVNWFFIPPYHTLRIGDTQNLVALLVFTSIAALVSAFVSTAARRAAEAARLRDEARTLASLVGVGGPDPMASIASHLVESFQLDGVSILRLDPATEAVTVEAVGGADPPHTLAEASFHRAVGGDVVLAARGRPLTSEDDRVLRSFVQQLARALEQRRLSALAAEAEALSQADALRTSLLRAVSHDLRTPLANVKAAVSSLRERDVQWSEADREDFLEAIEVDTDRLTAIITNLLDLSKLHAGALRPAVQETSVDEVVSSALHHLGDVAGAVRADVPSGLADVRADPALLERVVANLVANAVEWSPDDAEVRVVARTGEGTVQLHVIDHGPGIAAKDRAAVVQPFHRLDDVSPGGLGLGLAIADQMTAAMDGTLELLETPGGGLTAVVTLPAGDT